MISFCQDIHISYQYHYSVQPSNIIKKQNLSTKEEIKSLNSLQRVKKGKLEVLSKKQNSPKSSSGKTFIGIQISNPNKTFCKQLKLQSSNDSFQFKEDKSKKNIYDHQQKIENIVVHSPTTSKNIQTIRTKHKRTGSHEVGINHQDILFNYSKISQKRTYNFFNQPTIKKPQPTQRDSKKQSESTQFIDLQRSNQTKIFKKAIRRLQINKQNKQSLKTEEIDSDYDYLNDLQTPGKKKKFSKLKNINEISTIDNKQTLKLPTQKRNLKHNHFRSNILNDAVSIVSKNFQEQSFSMVEPEEFFYYQSQVLNRKNNFTIINNTICEKGYTLSLAIENQSKILCSLKHFQNFNQKSYLKQLENYHIIKQSSNNQFLEQILSLYQVIPNNKSSKLIMIKQPYTNSLQSYIKQCSQKQKKESFCSKVMMQIKKLISNLQKINLYIKQQESFEINDFVECLNDIKLQNISKIQKVIQNRNESKIAERSRSSEIKLDILQLKIKREFPSLLKI